MKKVEFMNPKWYHVAYTRDGGTHEPTEKDPYSCNGSDHAEQLFRQI